MSPRQTAKYFKYAIGEILLVVIGILIALQINNWNEARKNKLKEISFLEGIKEDLQKDSTELKRLDQAYKIKLANYKRIDTSFELPPDTPRIEPNAPFNFERLFMRGRSYRPNNGTYTSIISDGQSSLISNQKLLNKIQMIWNVEYMHMSSIYQDLKGRDENLQWKYTEIIKNPPYKRPEDIKDTSLIADIYYLHELVRFYHGMIKSQSDRISEALVQVTDEITTLKQ